jgi:predicted PurR-regulated permease PerM
MSDPAPRPSPKTIQNIVFGAILVALFLLVCRLFAPFFTVLLWSILFYIIFVPFHQRLTKNMPTTGPHGVVLKNVMAAIFSLGTIILILIPLSFVTFHFYRQILDLIHSARDYLSDNQGNLSGILKYISDFIEDITAGLVVIDPQNLQGRIMQLLSLSMQRLLLMSSALARNVGSFVVGLVFMLFCLFFFYLDGSYLSHLAQRTIPIRKEYMSALVGKFKDITRNLFLGYIMVALVQAVMAYIVFTIFRVKGSLVFAGLVLVCSFIPMFGAGLVWMPLGIIRLLSGNIAGGIVFLAVSGLFISLLDNFLRPFFLQNRIQLHPLVIFVSILGGVTVFGFNGLVLGPMIVILFLTVLDLFFTEHDINIE